MVPDGMENPFGAFELWIDATLFETITPKVVLRHPTIVAQNDSWEL